MFDELRHEDSEPDDQRTQEDGKLIYHVHLSQNITRIWQQLKDYVRLKALGKHRVGLALFDPRARPLLGKRGQYRAGGAGPF